MKKWIPVLIVSLLLMSIVSPALAEQSPRGQPTAASPVPTATPVNATAVNATEQTSKDKGQYNATIATHIPPGQLKLGKINAPPAIINMSLTPTAQATKTSPVIEAKLNLAKKVADTRIDVVTRQLELYKKQIARSSLSAEEKAGIIALVDRNLAWYQQQNENIQATTDLDMVNALAAAADLQSAQLQVNMKKDAGIIACDQLDARIGTARNVSVIAADKISTLKASGNSTVAIEGKLADYNAHVNAASQYSAAARAAFVGISSEADMDNGFNQGYLLIAQADLEMSRAYSDLKVVYVLYFNGIR